MHVLWPDTRIRHSGHGNSSTPSLKLIQFACVGARCDREPCAALRLVAINHYQSTISLSQSLSNCYQQLSSAIHYYSMNIQSKSRVYPEFLTNHHAALRLGILCCPFFALKRSLKAMTLHSHHFKLYLDALSPWSNVITSIQIHHLFISV